MTTTPMLPPPNHSIAELRALLAEAYASSTQGKWKRGLTSHHTETESGYAIGEFHHASDASFCEAAHEFVPFLLSALQAQPIPPAAPWTLTQAMNVFTEKERTALWKEFNYSDSTIATMARAVLTKVGVQPTAIGAVELKRKIQQAMDALSMASFVHPSATDSVGNSCQAAFEALDKLLAATIAQPVLIDTKETK